MIGTTRIAPAPAQDLGFKPENMADTLPVTDVETGAPLGIETDYGHVMLGIVAAIRAHQ